MSTNSGVFHVESADDLFFHLEVALSRYEVKKHKRVEDTFFLVMGLNHLREWIAPGYDYKEKAVTQAQLFFNLIYEQSDFKLINKLCNRTKHLSRKPLETDYEAELPISDWEDFSSVQKMSVGPPSAFYVDGEDIVEPLKRLLNFYRQEWFSKGAH